MQDRQRFRHGVERAEHEHAISWACLGVRCLQCFLHGGVARALCGGGTLQLQFERLHALSTSAR